MEADPEKTSLFRKRVVLWTLLLLSIPLDMRSGHVWNKCGYDCLIFGQTGPAAIAGEYLAGIMFVVCTAWLIFSHVSEWRHQRSGA
jgi:hypothetical protein